MSTSAEMIHRERIPNENLKGYYVRGWTSRSDKALIGNHKITDPAQQCPGCHGEGFPFDEETNRHRTHFMRYSPCGLCRGTGRKPDEKAHG